MEPPPPRNITGIVCLQASIAPRTLTAITASQNSVVISIRFRSSRTRFKAAATLTSASSRPNSLTLVPVMETTSSSRKMSP